MAIKEIKLSPQDCIDCIRKATKAYGCDDAVGEIEAMCDQLEEVFRINTANESTASKTYEDGLREMLEVLDAIESIVGDDACEEWDCIAAFHANKLTDREKQLQEKLSVVYRLAHGSNRGNSCYHVHENWREEVKAIRRAAAAHGVVMEENSGQPE